MKDEDELSEEEIEADGDLEEAALFQKDKSRSQGIVAAAILVAVIGGLILAIGLALYLAFSLQATPTVYISSAQSVFQSKDQISYHPRAAQKSQPALLQELQQSYMKLQLGKPSAQNLVNVELANAAHLAYRKTIRRLDYQNMKKIIEPYSRDLLTSESHVTYADYLQAVELLQLTTFPIVDFSPEKIEIQYAERQRYERKYSLSGMRDELKLSVIVLLTKKGLQSGDYFYALKSIYQQKYSNFEVIVVDNTPEMGMQQDIIDLLTQLGQNKTIILDKKSGQIDSHEGGAVYYALHKYCLHSDLVLILRDNGELIGKYAFALLNELHQSKQTPIIFTNYILEMGNSLAKLQDGYRYKVQIYPSLKDPANTRFDSYKTKYLKSYSAEVLLELPYTVFQNSKQQWNSGLFQASIEFAALEVSCGNYYLLEEILYRASKLDIETVDQINDGREHQKQICGGKQSNQEKSEADKQREAEEYQRSLLGIGNIRQFNMSELPLYRQTLNQFNAKKLIKWSAALQYYEKREKEISKDSEIKPLSGIKITQMTHAIRQAFMHSRHNIYGEVTTLNPEILEAIQNKNTLVKPPNGSMPMPPQHITHKQVNSFCIILHIDGGNSEFRPYYSLQSILKQKYSKYKVIILDNASTDNSTQSLFLHLNFIPDEEKKKIKYYKNPEKRSKMENVYFISQLFCGEDDIMMIVDGNEEIIGSTSLQKIDRAYIQKQALAVYSNYLIFEADRQLPELGISRPYSKQSIDSKNYKKEALLFNQLRSFKTSLFYNIKIQDLKDSMGNWIEEDFQFAISYPILEMACGKTHYLNEILYFTAPIKQFPTKQLLPENLIKTKKKSSPHKFSPLSIYNQQILAQTKYSCQQYVPHSSQLRGDP